MGYNTITWEGKGDMIKEIIEDIGLIILSDRSYRVRRDDLKRFEIELNKRIEEYLITNLRIRVKVLRFNDDAAAWCKARETRNIELEFYENGND